MLTKTPSKPVIIAVVFLAVLSINLDTTIVNVALPTIGTDLHAGTRSLQWVVDGYNLAFAGLVLGAGSLADRYGRRPALIIGLLGFAAASAAGAEMKSAGSLIAMRLLMGTFAALIYPTTLSIISNTFTERRERAVVLSAWGATVGIGVAAGPLVGGVLLEHFYWGSVFWALVPVALVTALAAIVVIPESKDPGIPPLDRRGVLTSTLMLSVLVYTIIEAPSRGWLDRLTLAGFGIAMVGFVLFVVLERRAEHPMLDLTLFADRRFSASCVSVTLAFFSLFGFIFLVTQYFQFIRGYGALATGVRVLPVAASIGVASMVGLKLVDRIGTKVVVATGMMLFAVTFFMVTRTGAESPYATVIVPEMVLLGAGLGLVAMPATELILVTLPPARAGVGSAVNDATRELGGTLGVAVIGSIFSSFYGHHLGLSDFAKLGSSALAQAQDSVGAGITLARSHPGLLDSVRSAFMNGVHAGVMVTGGLCLLGALFALWAFPGRQRVAVAVPGEAGLTAAHPVPLAVAASKPIGSRETAKQQIARLEAENARLRDEVARLAEEREVFHRAAKYAAKYIATEKSTQNFGVAPRVSPEPQPSQESQEPRHRFDASEATQRAGEDAVPGERSGDHGKRGRGKRVPVSV